MSSGPDGTPMSSIRNALVLLAAALLFAPVAARAATGDAVSGVAAARPRRVTEGTLLFRARTAEAAAVPAPLLETAVDVRVTGPIARAIVRQEFVNPTAGRVG